MNANLALVGEFLLLSPIKLFLLLKHHSISKKAITHEIFEPEIFQDC